MTEKEWLARWDRTSDQLRGEFRRRRKLQIAELANSWAMQVLTSLSAEKSLFRVSGKVADPPADVKAFFTDLQQAVVSCLQDRAFTSRASVVLNVPAQQLEQQVQTVIAQVSAAALYANSRGRGSLAQWTNELCACSRDAIDAIYGRVLELMRELFLQTMSTVSERDFWTTAKEQVGGQIWGSHESSWLMYYEFMVDQEIISADRKLDPLIELAKHCGWWSPYEVVAVLQHRHTKLSLTGERLHCEDGPALAYCDGYQSWMINGVRVDEQIVMRPETQTIAQINEEQNVEVMRVRIERFGWSRYLKESGAKVLDSRMNPVEGVRESLMHQEATELTVLVCACPSTGRVYVREVDPSLQTCEAAQKWLRRPLSRIVEGPELFAT